MLHGKTIVVTGAASGIGKAAVIELKQQGAAVLGVDRLAVSGADADFQADLADPHSIAELIHALPPGIDGLCNVAGLPPTFPAVQVLKVNCLGLKTLTLGLIDKMKDGGSITNVASLAGIEWPKSVAAIREFDAITDFALVEKFCDDHGVAGGRSYFFSKEFLIAWTMQNRWTWRARGIRMNCVSPGPVETPILKDFLVTLGARAEEDARLMTRPGRVTDIAPVIAFLQSDGSAWCVGANIACDGGMDAHVRVQMAGL